MHFLKHVLSLICGLIFKLMFFKMDHVKGSFQVKIYTPAFRPLSKALHLNDKAHSNPLTRSGTLRVSIFKYLSIFYYLPEFFFKWL